MKTFRRSRALALAVLLPAATAVVSLGSVAHAEGTNVRRTSDEMIVRASPGKVNDITVTFEVDRFVIHDAGDTLTADPDHCSLPDPNTASCPAFSVRTVVVEAGDLDDRVFFNASNPKVLLTTGELSGGDGDDHLQAGPLAKRVDLSGGSGNDTLRGGPGDDLLAGGPGPDGFFGGGGFDLVTYNGRTGNITADLDGEVSDDGEVNERDTIKTDVEGILGGRGNDTLTGNPSANRLTGSDGNDTLIGLGGDDELTGDVGTNTLDGGIGNDTLTGGPSGSFAQMLGGPGNDLLIGKEGLSTMVGGPGPSGTDLDSDRFFGMDDVGTALVDYSARTQPVTVTIDSVANDGLTGSNEHDLVHFTVNGAVGGSGADSLAAKNSVRRHSVFGGPGNDVIDTQDGATLDQARGGGPGDQDTCRVDASESFAECEIVVTG